ncbi:hypothetical protein Sps_05153 [Shewanella psychrophila]|uniref:Uncharacterized protein n=1 Tax=Shewanella psychrophila TaxID=225848 RepID=A0A1S6HXL7_9GAMM|nr:hypothetical protein Sps_05153 [Shewanella psychrophila]
MGFQVNNGIWNTDLYQNGLMILIGYMFCLVFWLFKNRTVNSFFICFVVWVIASVIMDGIEPVLFKTTGNVPLDRFLWYFGFALIDFLAIYTIFRWHQVEGLNYNRDCIVMCLLLAVLMSLQMLRYIERQVFGSDLLKEIYRDGIPLLNSFALVYLMFASTLQGRKLKNV